MIAVGAATAVAKTNKLMQRFTERMMMLS